MASRAGSRRSHVPAGEYGRRLDGGGRHLAQQRRAVGDDCQSGSFRPGSDMTIACDPIETLPVPEGQDPQEFKEQVIREFLRGQQRGEG